MTNKRRCILAGLVLAVTCGFAPSAKAQLSFWAVQPSTECTTGKAWPPSTAGIVWTCTVVGLTAIQFPYFLGPPVIAKAEIEEDGICQQIVTWEATTGQPTSSKPTPAATPSAKVWQTK